MNKLLTIFVLVFSLVVISPAESATLEVSPPGDGEITTLGGGDVYTNIQEAIDDANDGDTIAIHNGTYTEQLTITGKGLTLTGEDESSVISSCCGNDFM